VLGVGPDNFLTVEPEYQRRLALDSPVLAPHNQYLEAAAQTGLIGLAAWLSLLGTVVFSAWRARSLGRACAGALDEDAPVPLANAVIAAMAGWAVASAFLHLATFRTFLLVAVLGAALDARARRRLRRLRAEGWVPPAVPARTRWSPLSTPRRTAVAGVLALAVGGTALGGAAWAAGGQTRTTWTVTASVQLSLKYDRDLEEPGYDLNTLSRAGLVRTFGGIAMSPRFIEEGKQGLRKWGDSRAGTSVDVVASSASGLISYRAHAPSANVAATLALETRTAASSYMNSLSSLYGVNDVGIVSPATRVDVVPDRRALELPLAVIGGVAVLAGLALLGLAAARRARGRGDRSTAAPDTAPQPAVPALTR
jgi:hypothetical protein